MTRTERVKNVTWLLSSEHINYCETESTVWQREKGHRYEKGGIQLELRPEGGWKQVEGPGRVAWHRGANICHYDWRISSQEQTSGLDLTSLKDQHGSLSLTQCITVVEGEFRHMTQSEWNLRTKHHFRHFTIPFPSNYPCKSALQMPNLSFPALLHAILFALIHLLNSHIFSVTVLTHSL